MSEFLFHDTVSATVECEKSKVIVQELILFIYTFVADTISHMIIGHNSC